MSYSCARQMFEGFRETKQSGSLVQLPPKLACLMSLQEALCACVWETEKEGITVLLRNMFTTWS